MTIPVLFLHGWTMRGAVFEDVAERLGPDFTCYAPDLPGHGERVDDTLSLDACAALVDRWASRLNRPILVGWSMGAGAAWRYIEHHGTAALRGLITIDMSPRMLPAPGWDLGLLGQSAEAVLATSGRIEPDWPRMADSISRSMYARDSAAVFDRSAVREMLLGQDPAVLRPLWDDLVAMDARDTIAKIALPYLVCSGAQSRLYSREVADWIAETAEQAQVQSFAHSGHSPHLEEPDAFCDAIRRFVAAHRLATPEFEPEKT